MKSIRTYLRECIAPDMATPMNTVGMGNVTPLDGDIGFVAVNDTSPRPMKRVRRKKKKKSEK